MNRYQRDIILVVGEGEVRALPSDSRVECLNYIISHVDNIDGFCRANELVNRNRITSKRRKILYAAKRTQLKPFRFLINKN